jgi:hypothetical protein
MTESGQSHVTTSQTDTRPQAPLDQQKIPAVLSRARAVKEAMTAGKDPKTIPGYLSRGTNGIAFILDGVVAKVPAFNNAAFVQEEVTRLEKTKGVPRVVQLVASDVEQGIIVTELLPGINIQSLDLDITPVYQDTQILQLIDTIIALDARGLAIDPKPGNFMHDAEGFYILDPLDESKFYQLPNQIMGLMHMLTYKGPYKEQSDEQIINDYKRRYQTMIQLLTLVKNNYPSLYTQIQERDKQSRSEYGEKNGGFLKEGLFDDNPEISPLRMGVKSLLESSPVATDEDNLTKTSEEISDQEMSQ